MCSCCMTIIRVHCTERIFQYFVLFELQRFLGEGHPHQGLGPHGGSGVLQWDLTACVNGGGGGGGGSLVRTDPP